MGLTRTQLYGIGVLLIVLALSACSGGGAATSSYPLEGSWTLTTSQTAGGDIGDGSFSVSYLMDFLGVIYFGSGTLAGGGIDDTYAVFLSDFRDFSGEVQISYTNTSGTDANGDDSDDGITFSGTMSGNTVSGTYVGDTGTAYATYTGTFTATKNQYFYLLEI